MSRGIVPFYLAYGLAGAVFLSTLGVGVFAFAIPLLSFHDKTSGLLLGTAFSGYFLAKLIISPIAGKLADRTGPKPLLTGAAILGVVAPVAAFALRQHEILYAIQFCLGLSAGTMKPVSTAAIAAVIPEQKRGKVFGMCNAFYYAAFFLAPFVGGLLFYNRDLLPVLGFLITCMAINLAIILMITPADLPTISDEPHSKKKTNIDSLKGKTKALLLAVGARTACTACLITFYPALLSENLHGPAWLVGILFALPSFVACVGLPLGGWLADRISRETQTVAGMGISAASLAAAGQMETALGFVTAGLALGIGSSLSFPASMALAASTGKQQGRIMGWFHGAANAGFVVGPLLCGLLIEQYGNIPLPMAVMGALGLVSTLPLALFRIPASKKSSRPSLMPIAFSIALLAVPLICLGSRDNPPPQNEHTKQLTFAGIAMGNVVHMTLSGVNTEKGGEASQKSFETIAGLEALFSHRNVSGSVGRVNLSAGTAPEPVDKATFELVKRALKISKTSDGVFDITIGAVTILPYYYQGKAELDKAELVDYTKIELDEDRQTIFLPKKGMALDLGGLAKGTVLDGAAETLRQQGVPSALVEAGGDLYCYGKRSWKVGIQDPRGTGLLGVITVANAGVCGSGDYYQYAMTETHGKAKRKHHILDPKLLDSAGKSIAVTVIAPSAELADALATTLFILGPQEGKRLLNHYKKCSALWVLPDQSIMTSRGFPAISIK